MDSDNLCRNRGCWSECLKGFARWLEQNGCPFAKKSDYRDACIDADESGLCKCQQAQDDSKMET